MLTSLAGPENIELAKEIIHVYKFLWEYPNECFGQCNTYYI